jgi:cytoskeleton protein RodZ
MDEKKNVPAEKRPLPQQETFPELWDLKEMREVRGISLKDLFEKTRISQINLMAVENNDFKRLPPPVYARSFIRKYARAVGIDEQPILDRYERYIESLEPPQETGLRHRFLIRGLVALIAAGLLVFAVFLYKQGDRPSSPDRIEESASPAQEPVAPPPAEATPAQTTVVPDNAVPTAIAPGGAARTAALPIAPAQPAVVPKTPSPTVPGQPVQTATIKSPTAQTATAEKTPAQGTAAPSVTPTPVAKRTNPPTAPAGKTRHMLIEARELTWVRIAEDQNPSYQVLLKPGERIERSASDHFQLDIGNAGGIDVTFEGKRLGSLGEQMQVIHMRLPEKESGPKTP